MLACLVVKSYFASLDFALARVQPGLRQSLHGIGDVCQDIDSLVDDSKGANPEYGNKFQATGQDTTQSILRSKATCQLRR